jgi:phospholipase/carboxylesterase
VVNTAKTSGSCAAPCKASYGLSLGIANGDLFRHVLAWSPGFAALATRVGTPRVFVSHGTGDRVLPIDRCSRRLVPTLRDSGYDVDYREFSGGHEIPGDLLDAALHRFLTAR